MKTKIFSILLIFVATFTLFSPIVNAEGPKPQTPNPYKA